MEAVAEGSAPETLSFQGKPNLGDDGFVSTNGATADEAHVNELSGSSMDLTRDDPFVFELNRVFEVLPIFIFAPLSWGVAMTVLAGEVSIS